MIRWYDWVVAVLFADLTMNLLIAGFSAASLWEPMVYGFVAGLVIRVWETEYCQLRLKMETKSGQ